MMSHFNPLRRHLALAAVVCWSGIVQAQSGSAAAPPARSDTAVQGGLLKAVDAPDPAACLAACKQTESCSGYNFAAAALAPQGGNCRLYSGKLTDLAVRGVVSCHMPCDSDPALVNPLPTRTLPTTSTPLLVAPPQPTPMMPLAIGPAGAASGIAQRLPAAPVWRDLFPVWAEAGQLIAISGLNLSHGQSPTVTVGGVAAQVWRFTDREVLAQLGAGTTSGPVVLHAEGGSVTLMGTPLGGTPRKDFFVVSGPTVVQSIVWPTTPVASGDVLIVSGQNLARLGGLCLRMPGPPFMKPASLSRTDFGPGQHTTNTTMTLRLAHVDYQWSRVAGIAIEQYVGDPPPPDLRGRHTSDSFRCAPGSTNLFWRSQP